MNKPATSSTLRANHYFCDEAFDGPCVTRAWAARRRAIKRLTIRAERRASRRIACAR